jgi:PAS domain S-box-containing protein
MELNSNIIFSENQINKLFPFYLEINSDLKITSIGPSLKKITNGNLVGSYLFNDFSIERPFLTNHNWDNLFNSIHDLFIIKHEKSDLLLRGQFEYLEDRKTLIFIGTPWVQSIDNLKEKKLFISDFAIHDPTFDLLHIIKNIEINSEEIKILLSKLKQKSELIKQSEANYKATLNMASEIIYKTNRDGYFIYVNPAGQRISGYSNDELMKMRFVDLVRSDYVRQTVKKYLKQIKHSKESTYFEFPLITKLGDEKWLGQSVQLNSSNNNDFEFVALAIDITKQKVNEFALKDTNRKLELLQTLINNTTDAIQVSKENGQVVYLNIEASDRLGIPVNEASNYFVWDFEKIFENHNSWTEHVDKLKSEGSIVIEGRNINQRTGNAFPVEVTVRFIEINETGYIIANSRDITERKIIEENVRKQKEKYENIIANMNLGLLEVDLEEKIQFVNPGFEQISGYSKDEIIGKKASSIFVVESHLSLVLDKLPERAKGHSDMYEILVKNKTGENRWWMVSGAPNYDDKGVLIGSIGIHLDITLAKQLEFELEMAKMKAEESSKAKEAFLANMSHEIRTPLNAIIGMIRELNKEKLSEKQSYYVNNTSIASQHLLSVLNNILDISKIEAGELQIESLDFDLQSILNDVKSIMMAKCLEKNLFLQINHPENTISHFIGDQSRFRQILINLIGNAVKFTDNGGVTIDYQSSEMDSKNVMLDIVVTDTGIGMEPNFLKNIFNKFSQEDASISRKHGGSGLGMAITKELIQLMNGTINVKSEKNKGSKFTLRFILPIGKIENIDSSKLVSKQNKIVKILLVEDNEFNRIVAKNTLQSYNCIITEAQNGKEALVELNKNQNNFDIILMDLQMPVMDGFECTKIIRNVLKLNIPIIALTANAFKSELEHCKSIGMNECVTKPFEEYKLMEAIYRSIDNNYSAQEINSLISSNINLKLYNLSYLEEVFKGNKDQIQNMIDIFIDQIEKSNVEIRQFYANKNFDALYSTIHRIKPSIDSMGIITLKDVTRFIEKESKENNDSILLKEQIEVLIATLNEVLIQLKA